MFTYGILINLCKVVFFGSYLLDTYLASQSFEALESVLCDVIKKRLKRRDERRSGKGKRDGFRRIFMTSHMTLSALQSCIIG